MFEHISIVLARLGHRKYLASERASIDYCDEVVDGSGRKQYLDITRSVSALTETETDADYVSNHNELFELA